MPFGSTWPTRISAESPGDGRSVELMASHDQIITGLEAQAAGDRLAMDDIGQGLRYETAEVLARWFDATTEKAIKAHR
jgi:hypothetical protein